jgi:hypothetical protein
MYGHPRGARLAKGWAPEEREKDELGDLAEIILKDLLNKIFEKREYCCVKARN